MKKRKKPPISGNFKVQIGDLSPNKYQPRVHFERQNWRNYQILSKK